MVNLSVKGNGTDAPRTARSRSCVDVVPATVGKLAGRRGPS
jgi:hypothetical protein